MKCKFCGAEVNSEATFCPFCNSEIVKEKPTVNVTNNYYGSSESANTAAAACPRCGSHNLKFRREEVGNTKSKTSKQVYYRTVAICQSCGTTWVPNATAPKKTHSVWWWILVILFYPISLTIWFIKTPKLKLEKKYRIIIVAAFWVIMTLIGILAPKTETPTDLAPAQALSSQSTESVSSNFASVWASEATPLNDFDYYIDGTEIFLKKYIGRDKKVRIPTYYDVDGTKMTVVSLDGTFTLKTVESVILPNKLRSISDNCFNSCGIEFLYIPKSLKDVSPRFWGYFHDLEKVYFNGTEEQWKQLCTVEREKIEAKQIIFNTDVTTLE